jgi:hypothetical protein
MNNYNLIFNLPIEIWKLIFKSVNFRDKTTCRLICKSWKYSLDDKSLWEDIPSGYLRVRISKTIIPLESIKWHYYIMEIPRSIRDLEEKIKFVETVIIYLKATESLWLLKNLAVDDYDFMVNGNVFEMLFNVACFSRGNIRVIRYLYEFQEVNSDKIPSYHLRISYKSDCYRKQQILDHACEHDLSSVRWVKRKFGFLRINSSTFMRALKRSCVLATVLIYEFDVERVSGLSVFYEFYRLSLENIICFYEIYGINRDQLIKSYNYGRSDSDKIMGMLDHLVITVRELTKYNMNRKFNAKPKSMLTYLTERSILTGNTKLLKWIYKKAGHDVFHEKQSICFGYHVFGGKKEFTRAAIDITHLSKTHIYNSLIIKSNSFMEKKIVKRIVNYCGIPNIPRDVLKSLKFNASLYGNEWFTGRLYWA